MKDMCTKDYGSGVINLLICYFYGENTYNLTPNKFMSGGVNKMLYTKVTKQTTSNLSD